MVQQIAPTYPECLRRLKLFESKYVDSRGKLNQPGRAIIFPFVPQGTSANGLWVQHLNFNHGATLPAQFGVIMAVSENVDPDIQVGKHCMFERYATEPIAVDDEEHVTFHVINADDITVVYDGPEYWKALSM